MKNKYWVSYKIPDEIKDVEGGFYIYAFNDFDAKYEALRKIKEEFPGIKMAYDDDVLLDLMDIVFEYPVDFCHLCDKILEINDDYFVMRFYRKFISDEKKMTFCEDCWYGLMNEITLCRLSSQKTNEN
jgi:hypothetical protein